MRYILTLFVALSLMACEQAQSIVDTLDTVSSSALSEDQIVQGLREALRVGTDSSISVLGLVDGYFADEAVKILLPEEANTIMSYIDDPVFKNLGITEALNSKFDDLILGVNRAAEWAVDSTGPIFYSAIFDSMTITDGLSILNGDDTSATHYLKVNTTNGLTKLFYPYMDQALSIKFVGDYTPKGLWKNITETYNGSLTEANLAIDAYNLFATDKKDHFDAVINTDLTSWSTNKGLNGMFLKIGEQESLIRNDPVARVTQILKDVFGSVVDNTAVAEGEL